MFRRLLQVRPAMIGLTVLLIASLFPVISAAATANATYQEQDLALVQDGSLTVATSPDYPPAEFIDPEAEGADSFTGYDMDLARELASRLGLEFNPQQASFDTIITDLTGPPLGQQRADIAISSFTINAERQERVNMIPYFRIGESLLVPSGNPNGIDSVDDLCGRPVAVQNGTIELSELQDANGEGDGTSGQDPVCQDDPVQILSFDTADQAILQVINGRADASYQDDPVTGYYTELNPGQVEVGGITVEPAPVGIAVRKDNPALETALRDALAAMMADGTYLEILDRWGVTSGACGDAECTTGAGGTPVASPQASPAT